MATAYFLSSIERTPTHPRKGVNFYLPVHLFDALLLARFSYYFLFVVLEGCRVLLMILSATICSVYESLENSNTFPGLI
jgi:hypothetical protein